MSTVTLTPIQGELLRLLDSTPRSTTELAFATQREPHAVRSTLLSLGAKGLAKRDLPTGRWMAA